MTKLNKEFFINDEVLFWDHSKKGTLCPFSKRASNAFSSLGIKLITIENSEDESKANFSGLQRVPKSAYVLYDRKDEQNTINQLIQNGVQHILFHPLMAPSKAALNECKVNGVETIIGCPMMVLGKGLCKVHSLFI